MNIHHTFLAAIVACLVAFAPPATAAKVDLGLRSSGQTCDGKGTYGYVASWRSSPNATFYVNSGNGCRSGGKVCGVGGSYCLAQCSKKGECRIEMRQCGVAGARWWVRMTSTDRSVQDQITAAAPSPCYARPNLSSRLQHAPRTQQAADDGDHRQAGAQGQPVGSALAPIDRPSFPTPEGSARSERRAGRRTALEHRSGRRRSMLHRAGSTRHPHRRQGGTSGPTFGPCAATGVGEPGAAADAGRDSQL